MANYNNTYGTMVESRPRYSRNSKMDLEARRRSEERIGGTLNSSVTPISYGRSTTKRTDSAVRTVGRTTAPRSTATRTANYGRTTSTPAYGTQRTNGNYGRATTPVTGVRRGETGINSRKVSTMGNTHSYDHVYQEGNTMRYAGEAPLRRKEAARKAQEKQVTPKRKANVGAITRQYTMFLAVVTICVAGMSMSFLNIQSNVNTKASLINTLQKNIADLSVENDSAYGAISQNMNMESVKERAEEMGMEYADSTQVIEYDAPMEDTVKQYETIPTSGVLAQSERTSE